MDYLLGPHCYKLYARDAYGSISSTPPWNLVLSYELEVRRKMVEIMARGVTIDQALDQARKDPIVKERHFVTPLAIGATTGKRSAPSYDLVLAGAPMAKKPKGPKVSKGKGKGKEKGKDKGKSARQECASTPPRGEEYLLPLQRPVPGVHPAAVHILACVRQVLQGPSTVPVRCLKGHPRELWSSPGDSF